MGCEAAKYGLAGRMAQTRRLLCRDAFFDRIRMLQPGELDGEAFVEVTDHAPGRVAPDPPDPLAANGRGLGIVERTCQRWGISYTAAGKTVWAEWNREPDRPGS